MRRRVLASLCFAAALALPLLAHELGLVQVEATFQKDGTYIVDLLVDREHLPLQAKGMAVPPDVFLRSIEKSAVIAFDGRPEEHENVATAVVEGKP
ncbi:MAG: hypothetical protein JO088_20745, partial [Acidobacteria bacterium]|nr:hypothetical protein [Acidobacteriota bacterium]